MYISDLTLGAAYPALIHSLDSIDNEINKEWNNDIVKPLNKYGYSTPKLKLPTNGSLMTLTSSAVQTTFNEILGELNLSKEIDPILKLAWNKKDYNRQSKRFIGKNLTCDEVIQDYKQIEQIHTLDDEGQTLDSALLTQSIEDCVEFNRGNSRGIASCLGWSLAIYGEEIYEVYS